MDDASEAAELIASARRIRAQARRLQARAESLAPGPMREMLAGQAAILATGADGLDAKALALAAPMGTA
jgi:hypothetical protein